MSEWYMCNTLLVFEGKHTLRLKKSKLHLIHTDSRMVGMDGGLAVNRHNIYFLYIRPQVVRDYREYIQVFVADFLDVHAASTNTT